MNHLAHLYLSRSNVSLMIGNFIADEVKGKQFENFPPLISQGIKMHRAIDHFTDTHEITLHTKSFFKPKFRLYSGVLVDMIYDHVLAKNWNHYHDQDLQTFASDVYNMLSKNENDFPEFSKFFLEKMKQYNWLWMYSTEEGISSVIKSMARRIKLEGMFDDALTVYQMHKQEIDSDFKTFFPQLAKEVEPFLKTN